MQEEEGESLKSKSKKSGRTVRRKGVSHFTSKKFKSDSEKREVSTQRCENCLKKNSQLGNCEIIDI
jgi:hypothetical protein